MAYHPASNELVKHVNRKTVQILCHVAGELNETCQDWLLHVAASINYSLNASTGKTPYYIVFSLEKAFAF